MKLLSLLIVLATLLYTSYARYDVYFDSRFVMKVDGKDYAKISGCRYNSDEKVYCEVEIDMLKTCEERKDDHDKFMCQVTNLQFGTKYMYRLRFDLKLRNFTSTCRNHFKSSKHFMENNLMYGKNSFAINLANLNDDVRNGVIPDKFGTFENRKYYFRFVTKKGCIFYGDFDTVHSTYLGKK
ncbi:hypothetical protein PIROE2DRAFT_3294 [Piromyces sp. E2]|nr:hypothetical protein PIROE2DRAFT_3294 [Piromyces sp. E2]|eukprot:OUM68905.1 hypothetical protein PIROE2DRAFT_3294 [Piromyces sp. E2]